MLLGIDVGTGGSKALLIDGGGVVRGAETTGYPLMTPRPQWAEQDPRRWWSATARSIGRVLEEAGATGANVEAVGLTGQMHGLVLLDAGGEVLRPAILWNDQRTGDQCQTIHQRVGKHRVLEITGKPALTGFTAPKLLWVAECEPETYGRAAHMLLPKDYVRYRLTGAMASDVADASGTTLFDVGRRRWSQEMIEALNVPATWLPEVHESSQVIARVDARGAAATGLLEGTPVVAGAGDQAAEALGCGVVEEGAVSVTVGTSGVVFAATDDCRIDPGGRLHAYCHALPGRWHLMGVMLSAGGCLRWYRDTFLPGEPAGAYETLMAQAAEAPPGSEGLIFLPYLTGERTPHADPQARGAFVGLTLRHGAGHMIRAVLEGVAFGLRDCVEPMLELGIRPRRYRISGGGARSELWRRIIADVLDTPVVTVNVTQGAAFGAALLAGVGAGVFGDGAAAASLVHETHLAGPGPDAAAYARGFEHYRSLYPALSPCFRAISEGLH